MPGLISFLRTDCFASVVVLLAFAFVTAARASEPQTAEPEPTSSQNKPEAAAESGLGCGAGPFPRPTLRIGHPQPNLRHATPRYEVALAVSPADAALIELLDQPLPEGGMPEWNESPLRDIQRWIAETYNVPVGVDGRILKDAGLDLDTPISLPPVKGGSLKAALRVVLDGHDLAVTVRHGGLVLTTIEKASEQLLVGAYPLPTQLGEGVGGFVDTIQSIIAAETWETVGGQGAIRFIPEANALGISQTLDTHMQILAFMRATFDSDLVARPGHAPGQLPVRVYRLRDPKLTNVVVENLTGLCNSALGAAGDEAATVTVIGEDRIVVQSGSRPFHIYAAEMIRSLDGAID